MTTRRAFSLGLLGAAVAACRQSSAPNSPSAQRDATRSFAEIEQRIGGRVGVHALDTGTGRELGYRAEERFAMCSTFKWLLVAAVLARADRSELSLDERVAYGEADLLEYAPFTREHVAEGGLTVAALAESAIVISDNTAANLLLAKTGGPEGITRFARALGDSVTRLDRTEETLNSNQPGDPRDTTSPRAMTGLGKRILCGDSLSEGSRQRLIGWLRACETGKKRLRAGLPQDWVVGDKTGTGARGAMNDFVIAVPPQRAPILLAAYLSESTAPPAALEAAHAEIARIVARESMSV